MKNQRPETPAGDASEREGKTPSPQTTARRGSRPAASHEGKMPSPRAGETPATRKDEAPSANRGRRLHAIRAHYEPRISPAMEHYEILDWASPRTQEARFRVLADNVELGGRSLLDVGCGLGDLRAYLLGRGIAVEYTGVDVSPPMVQAALERQPDGRFLCADLFGEEEVFPESSFDVVYCSGIFNLDLGNNEDFVPQAVARFLGLARRHVACNMLHKRAGDSDGTYFFYDPLEVLARLRPLGCRVRLIDDYLPNDFTLICEK